MLNKILDEIALSIALTIVIGFTVSVLWMASESIYIAYSKLPYLLIVFNFCALLILIFMIILAYKRIGKKKANEILKRAFLFVAGGLIIIPMLMGFHYLANSIFCDESTVDTSSYKSKVLLQANENIDSIVYVMLYISITASLIFSIIYIYHFIKITNRIQ